MNSLVLIGLLIVISTASFAFGEAQVDCQNVRRNQLDLFILLDSSTSIHEGNFTKVLNFVKQFVEQLDIGANATHVGILQFNGDYRLEFSMNEYYEKDRLLKAITDITYTTGVTHTGKAITYVTENEFTESKGGRVKAPNVAVVVTDGYAQDDVVSASNLARANGVDLIAVGISRAVNTRQLLEMVGGSSSRVFFLDDFESFKEIVNSLINQIYQTAISNACAGSTITTQNYLSTTASQDVTLISTHGTIGLGGSDALSTSTVVSTSGLSTNANSPVNGYSLGNISTVDSTVVNNNGLNATSSSALLSTISFNTNLYVATTTGESTTANGVQSGANGYGAGVVSTVDYKSANGNGLNATSSNVGSSFTTTSLNQYISITIGENTTATGLQSGANGYGSGISTVDDKNANGIVFNATSSVTVLNTSVANVNQHVTFTTGETTPANGVQSRANGNNSTADYKNANGIALNATPIGTTLTSTNGNQYVTSTPGTRIDNAPNGTSSTNEPKPEDNWTTINFATKSPVDGGESGNGQLGGGYIRDVDVRCDDGRMQVLVKAGSPFKGWVFIKGHFDDLTCRWNFYNNTETELFVLIKYDQCGVQRARSANPRGIYISAVIVFMKHAQFLTQGDKAYRLQCFYMEADKIVTASLDVSMLSTQTITKSMDMPACQYSLRSGTFNGPVAKATTVGQKIVHRWDCEADSNSVMAYGMRVHSCYVSNSLSTRKVLIVDEKGCAVDRFILGNLNYTENLMSAFVEGEVFKFADSEDLLFNCQVGLCLKEAGGCVGVTPPSCSGPTRGKRTSNDIQRKFEQNQQSSDDFDVTSETLFVLDRLNAYDDNVNRRKEERFDDFTSFATVEKLSGNICLSNPVAIATATAIAFLAFWLVAFTTFVICHFKVFTSFKTVLKFNE